VSNSSSSDNDLMLFVLLSAMSTTTWKPSSEDRGVPNHWDGRNLLRNCLQYVNV
jgi:hypothetical protein